MLKLLSKEASDFTGVEEKNEVAHTNNCRDIADESGLENNKFEENIVELVFKRLGVEGRQRML